MMLFTMSMGGRSSAQSLTLPNDLVVAVCGTNTLSLEYDGCIAGLEAGYLGKKNKKAACQGLVPSALTDCQTAYDEGISAKSSGGGGSNGGGNNGVVGLQQGMKRVCKVLKSKDPDAFNSNAFCQSQADSATKKEEFKNFCTSSSDNYGPIVKQACSTAAIRGDLPTDDESTEAEEAGCGEGANTALAWIVCPLIEGARDTGQVFFSDILEPLLKEVPVSSQKKSPSYQAWSSFRILATVILVGVLMVVVYGTARGGS